MDLDDMKQAWQALDRKLDRQHAVHRQLLVERRLDHVQRGLRPLVWGQSVQIAFGIGFALLGAWFWGTHRGMVDAVTCGVLVQAFGVALMAFGGRVLSLVRRIDYASPVLDIQRRLASLRRWRVRVEAPVFSIVGSFIWVPLLMMLFQGSLDTANVDLGDRFPGLWHHLVLSGVVSLLLVLVTYVALRAWGKLPWLENHFAGPSVQRAEAILREIDAFEQE
ncbi:hypothetical protein [Dyella sp.]|uniref:hypothetical protein n=1 Tax=Dyella sp. TaxID=1869338 RepID=UPI002ECFC36F